MYRPSSLKKGAKTLDKWVRCYGTKAISAEWNAIILINQSINAFISGNEAHMKQKPTHRV